MSKQDRQGVRSPTDLERKYDLAAIAGLKKATKNSEEGLTKTNAILEQFMIATLGNLDNMQSQIDGSITTHFYSGVPTLVNKPANTWTSEKDKNNHLGDLYYDKDSGYAYRFSLDNEEYIWIKLTDSDVTEALAIANSAKDTADGKRRVFTEQPAPPYDIGDLWFKDKEIYICQLPKPKGKEYLDGDFVTATKYTDDSTALKIQGDFEEFVGIVKAEYSTTVEMQSAIIKSEEKLTSSFEKTVTEHVELTKEQIGELTRIYTGSKRPAYDLSKYKDGDLYVVDSNGGSIAGNWYRFEVKEGFDENGTPVRTLQWVLLKNYEIEELKKEAEELAKNIEENYSTTQEVESKIQQTAEEIDIEVKKKVGEDEIISKINMTPETIKILAECIDVDGVLDVEKLNALSIKAGSVDAENITGQRIDGKEFTTLSRNKLDENVVGLYIGSDGFDYCWDATNEWESDVYGHVRITKKTFSVMINDEILMSFSASSRVGGGGSIGHHAYVPTLLCDMFYQNDE